MITQLEYLWGLSLPNSAMITELVDCTPKPAVELLSALCAGDVVPQFVGGHGAQPQVDFRSPQIKTILDACGLYGYDTSAGNTDLHYRAGTNLSTRAAIGLRVRCLRALLHWTQISARQKGAAEISCSLIPTFDGTNAPLSVAGSSAVPVLGALPQQYYTLGPVVVNGAALAGVSDWSLDLGVKTNVEAADGESYPSWCGVESHSPVLTVNCRAIGAWYTAGMGGTALTSLAFYLRKKRLDNMACEENATAVHIKFTAAKGLLYVDQLGGGADGPASCTVKIYLRRAAPADIHCLAVDTASVIA
jgi:hypothetical protein